MSDTIIGVILPVAAFITGMVVQKYNSLITIGGLKIPRGTKDYEKGYKDAINELIEQI